MKPADMNTLQALDSILRDNLGNRLTAALVNGVVNTLHDHMAARQVEQKAAEAQKPAA